MWNISELVIAFLLSSVTTLLVTPFIIKLAIKLGAIDKPDQRKIHNGIKPSMGGLAIVIGVFVGYLYLMPDHAHMNAIIIWACIMVLTCVLDDIFALKAIYKLICLISVVVVVVSLCVFIDIVSITFL